jgi:hypothetical protein
LIIYSIPTYLEFEGKFERPGDRITSLPFEVWELGWHILQWPEAHLSSGKPLQFNNAIAIQ